ncbi:MAG: hypothetical protein JO026_02720 [Patescibacteria group bacterium]|nr:hypothetical protein [Patescibacteria group bacterium]
MKDLQTLVRSPLFTKVLVGIGGVLILFLVFQAGVAVGIHKAGANFRMGENYYRALGENGRDFFGQDFSEAHGAVGSILSVSLPNFILEEKNNTEKVVVIGNQTVIRDFRNATSAAALIPGKFVIVLGDPDDNGWIKANLVRILPPPGPAGPGPAH